MKATVACVLVSLPLLLTGCVIAPAEQDDLPAGVTLLDSDNGHCHGPMEIDTYPEMTVDEGEQTVVAVDDDEDIDWQCVSGVDSDQGELECPDGTTHIRVMREDDESEFSMECYGSV